MDKESTMPNPSELERTKAMPLYKTVIEMHTFHEVLIHADSKDDVPDAINDLDSAVSVTELYDRSSWDVEDIDNIQEIKQ